MAHGGVGLSTSPPYLQADGSEAQLQGSRGIAIFNTTKLHVILGRINPTLGALPIASWKISLGGNAHSFRTALAIASGKNLGAMASQPAKESSPTRASPTNESTDIANDAPKPVTYSPEEVATLLQESNERKSEATTLFASKNYPAAIAKYDEAIDVCPHHLDYELAVLRCNVSACHLKLDEWKDAISSATAALEGLSRVEARDVPNEKKGAEGDAEDEDVEEEIISSGAADAAPMPVPEDEASKRKADVKRIRAKALMRRARARSELGGWQNLAGAEEDYKVLVAIDNLGPADRKIVGAQLRELPPRVKAAQEQETAEMWAKLKDLGNGILRPFGLSTDNFQMKKDEKTGGYSMNFNGSG